MTNKTTNTLMNTLLNVEDIGELDKYINENTESQYKSFTDYFFSIDKVKAQKKSELIRKSQLSREYAYEITRFNSQKKIGRDKLIALCLAANLSIDETQRGLKIAKEPLLYSKDRRDTLLIYALNHQYDVLKTNELLDSYSLPPLDGTTSNQ